MAASTTAYPPSSGATTAAGGQHRLPPAAPPPSHRAQSQSASSPYAPSLPSRPNGTAGGQQPFKPMYDLPPGFHQQTQSVGGGGGPLPQRSGAGGLSRLRSPPLAQPERGSPGGLHASSSSAASAAAGGSSRSASQTPPLHQPQPRRPPASPSLLNTASSPPPPSLRSPTVNGGALGGGSTSVFSKAPQNASSPAPGDIAVFTAQCRRVFYLGDGQAQRYVEHVLRSLPPSHKAAFIRAQNRVRQAFHARESLRRRMEFDALLAGTTAGGALTVKGRREPRGSAARKERSERLKRFLDTHAGKANVGPKPLLTALAGVLRLQAQAVKKGGPGPRRIEWEVDDAVWMECGGRDFMAEAIAVVKGVLGFEDVPRPAARTRRRSDPASSALVPPAPFALARSGPSSSSSPASTGQDSPDAHSPGQDVPFLSPRASPAAAGSSSGGRKRGKAPPPPTAVAPRPPPLASSASYDPDAPSDPLRPRAGSDPFSDARNGNGGGGRQPSANRRGPAPPVPSKPHYHPTQPHPAPAALKDRTFSHSSAFSSTTAGELEPATPGGAEDHRLLASAYEDDGDGGSDALSLSSSISFEADADFDAAAADDDDGLLADVGALSGPRWRTWLAPPHLTNPELSALLRLFPAHISKPSKGARTPYVGPGQSALEEGLLSAGTGTGAGAGGGGRPESVRSAATGATVDDGRVAGRGVGECGAWGGTGRVWVGVGEREVGWRGTAWARFCAWWRALFS